MERNRLYSPNKMERHQKQDEVAPPLKKKRNEESAPTQKDDEDLLLKLGNDIVFGEVMNRLPWYHRPILKTLSRSWADAITNYFPSYARIHHPRILSQFIVLFRTEFPNCPANSNDNLALWLYSCNCPITWKLPVPQIPVRFHKHVKFVCDDNDECIYSFLYVLEKGYDVEVLDLREGSWKRLPSLPVCTDSYVCSCSSTSTSTSTVNGNGRTTCILKAMESDTYAFSQWTLTDCEDKWECQSVISKPLGFAAEEKKPPFYVEIEKDPGTQSPPKWLFQRSETPDLSSKCSYILMLQEDTAVPGGYNFYVIRIYNESVELYKTKVKESRSIAEDEEGHRFWDFWQSQIDGFNLSGESEERNAIKVSAERRDKIGSETGDVQVAQGSRSLYFYRLIGRFYGFR